MPSGRPCGVPVGDRVRVILRDRRAVGLDREDARGRRSRSDSNAIRPLDPGATAYEGTLASGHHEGGREHHGGDQVERASHPLGIGIAGVVSVVLAGTLDPCPGRWGTSAMRCATPISGGCSASGSSARPPTGSSRRRSSPRSPSHPTARPRRRASRMASAIVIIPFSILGPFAGVFIDRWSRRKIMVVAPLLRAAPVFLVLLNPDRLRRPVLRRGALGHLGEPVLPRDRAGGGTAARPHGGPPRPRTRSPRWAAPWRCSSACSRAVSSPRRSATARSSRSPPSRGWSPPRSRSRSAATFAPTSSPRRPSCSATRSGGSGSSSPTGSSTSCAPRARSARSPRSRSTRWDRGSCSSSRSSSSKSDSTRAWARSRG